MQLSAERRHPKRWSDRAGAYQDAAVGMQAFQINIHIDDKDR
jgi:hypothetical protein